MRLSKRLERIVEAVPNVGVTADICCDHAYTAIELIRRGKAQKAIACDIRPYPLSNAKQGIIKAGLSDRVETRLGDGLCPLLPGEADAVIISGIGGDLMIRILSGRLRDFRFFILSPHSMWKSLRQFILSEGVEIIAEDMLKDGGKYYQIITASSYALNEKSEAADNIGEVSPLDLFRKGELEDYMLSYGPLLLKNKDKTLYEYLIKEKNRIEKNRIEKNRIEKNRIEKNRIKGARAFPSDSFPLDALDYQYVALNKALEEYG